MKAYVEMTMSSLSDHLSNHDSEGDENVKNLHVQQWKQHWKAGMID